MDRAAQVARLRPQLIYKLPPTTNRWKHGVTTLLKLYLKHFLSANRLRLSCLMWPNSLTTCSGVKSTCRESSVSEDSALSSTGLFLCFSKELTSLGDNSTRVLEILHSRLLFYSWWVGLLLQASLFCWSGSWLLFGRVSLPFIQKGLFC